MAFFDLFDNFIEAVIGQLTSFEHFFDMLTIINFREMQCEIFSYFNFKRFFVK